MLEMKNAVSEKTIFDSSLPGYPDNHYLLAEVRTRKPEGRSKEINRIETHGLKKKKERKKWNRTLRDI